MLVVTICAMCCLMPSFILYNRFVYPFSFSKDEIGDCFTKYQNNMHKHIGCLNFRVCILSQPIHYLSRASNTIYWRSRHGSVTTSPNFPRYHDDVIKWKHFPRCWPFVRGIHRSAVDSPHKGQWRGTLMFSLIYAWIKGSANNRDAGDLRRHRAHYDVTVMM